MVQLYTNKADCFKTSFSISDVNPEKKWAIMWLLHKHFPSVPTIMHNVPLNFPLFSGKYMLGTMFKANVNYTVSNGVFPNYTSGATVYK